MTEDTKQLERLDYKPPEHTDIKNSGKLANSHKGPNKEIMIIDEIEGLISQVNDKLNKINTVFTTDNPKPWQAKDMAIEEIDLFQKTTLFELRKAFE